MTEVDLVEDVLAVRDVDAEAFQARVDEEAAALKDTIREGSFDNPGAAIGLEYEFYAVADPEASARRVPVEDSGCLVRVPRRLLDTVGFEKELGLHNAELCSSPQPTNRYGIRAQLEEVRARVAAAHEVTVPEGIRLVSDGLWTIPPAGESAREYLTATATERGVTVATNMSSSVRYHAMADSDAADVGMVLQAPHVELDADTVMPESLITSIQPHYQVPQAVDLPDYFRYALRVAAPLLALGANAPFFPPDLYDDGTTIDDVLADGWRDHRIPVFETVLNARAGTAGKVRFPRDLPDVEAAIDRVVEDDLLVPMEVETAARYDDAYAHFRHKHGSYWRWVRPVFDGPTEAAANVRIEFRPVSAQPTVRDSVAVQVAFAGLLSALVRTDHPVRDLDWATAHENFYAAVHDGLDAELTWITNDGRETRTNGAVYGDLLAQAADGLRHAGLTDRQMDRYLEPLRARLRTGTTPASWKRERAREAAADGADLAEAIERAQRAYLERQRDTLLRGSFADWLD